MSLGSAFRQIVESMPENQQKEYKERIMTKVTKQFSEVIKKQEHDILNDIDDLIDRLFEESDYDNKHSDQLNSLLRDAATTIDILAERIIDSENNSALRVYNLEQQLLTKQAYVEYLQSRLTDFDIGYQPECK